MVGANAKTLGYGEQCDLLAKISAAGITLDTASGSKTSVHVGCFTREYDHMSYRDPELQPKYQASGSGFALLANRLSWYYNLTGPSMVIDSACSSSLNALHLGCESLRRGESDMVATPSFPSFCNC